MTVYVSNGKSAGLRFQAAAEYVISRQRIEQLQSSFGFVFLLFPKNVVGYHTHSNHENPQALYKKPWMYMYKLLLLLPSLG